MHIGHVELAKRFTEFADRLDYLLTGARLTILDWFAGMQREMPTDRTVREQGERLQPTA